MRGLFSFLFIIGHASAAKAEAIVPHAARLEAVPFQSAFQNALFKSASRNAPFKARFKETQIMELQNKRLLHPKSFSQRVEVFRRQRSV